MEKEGKKEKGYTYRKKWKRESKRNIKQKQQKVEEIRGWGGRS